MNGFAVIAVSTTDVSGEGTSNLGLGGLTRIVHETAAAPVVGAAEPSA